MTTETKTLTLTDIVDHLHPAPGPYLLRMVFSGPASDGEDYLRLYAGRWECLGAWAPGRGPGIPELIAQNSWCRVRVSPNLTLVPNVSEQAPVDVVTVRIPLPPAPPERAPSLSDSALGFGSYDDLVALKGQVGLHALEQKRLNDELTYSPASAELVLSGLRGLDPQPSLVVNEGDAIVACFRLSQRVAEQPGPGYRMTTEGMPVPSSMNRSRLGLLHHRLAMRLSGDVNAAARPFMMLIDAPGVRRTDIKLGARPCPVVTAEMWNDSSYTLEQLEALATTRG